MVLLGGVGGGFLVQSSDCAIVMLKCHIDLFTSVTSEITQTLVLIIYFNMSENCLTKRY